MTFDISLDADPSLNQTVIDLSNEDRSFSKRAASMGSADMRSGFLRKQFSIDQGKKVENRPVSENLEIKHGKPLDALSIPPPPSQLPSPTLVVTGLPPKIPFTSRLQMNVLKDSSSTSTDDTASKDDRAAIPTISTTIVQDEIAKLSSNIKNAVEEKGVPFNETMC